MCPMAPELAHALNALDPAVLGARIKAARVAAGLTQPALAGTDASVAFLSRIESGQRRPSPELLEALASRLGVTVEYLVLGDGWEDARRLELQLDHAELSLAGGEAANGARPRPARSSASPGSRPSPVARSGPGTSRRPRSTPSVTPPRPPPSRRSSRARPTPPPRSRPRPRCAGSGASRASSTRADRLRPGRARRRAAGGARQRGGHPALASPWPPPCSWPAAPRRPPSSATGRSRSPSGSSSPWPGPRPTGTPASSAPSPATWPRRSRSRSGPCTCWRTPSGSATSAGCAPSSSEIMLRGRPAAARRRPGAARDLADTELDWSEASPADRARTTWSAPGAASWRATSSARASSAPAGARRQRRRPAAGQRGGAHAARADRVERAATATRPGLVPPRRSRSLTGCRRRPRGRPVWFELGTLPPEAGLVAESATPSAGPRPPTGLRAAAARDQPAARSSAAHQAPTTAPAGAI